MRDLQIEEDMDFQYRQWRWQRIGWGLFTVIIIGALLGIFGNGPLSASTSSTADHTLTVAWERIARRQGLAEFTVTVAPGAIQAGRVTIWFDPATASQIDSANPEPVAVVTSGDRVSWTLAADPATGPVSIIFEFTPTEMGWNTVSLGIAGGADLEIRQIVLP